MRRAGVAFVPAAAIGLAGLVPVAGVAQAAPPAPEVQAVESPHVDAAKKKKKKVKKVVLRVSQKRAQVDSIIRLNGRVKPKQKAHVGFQQRFPRSKKWHGIKTRTTKKNGRASVRVQLGRTGTFRYRMIDKKKKSNAIKVQSTAKPTPPPPVPPGPKPTPVVPTSSSVTWPGGQLAQDKQYEVPVQVNPAVNVQVRLQSNSGSGWEDLYGGTDNTGKDGKAKLIMSVPDTGDVNLRVAVTNYSDANSDSATRNFTDQGDALYGVPLKLPNKTGQIVKAQQFPVNWPKLKLPNPLDKTKTLVLPEVGTPAAGPPTCMTDDTPAAQCKIQGKQYRFMYTTERWYPNEDGTGSVQNGTVAATALLFVPDNVSPNANVVVWAHPTIGQENKCSVSRGVDPIPITNGKTGVTTMGPGGMNTNLTDVAFFLDQMLSKGYVVVMPDYLGIAVEALDANQTNKTYAVGPQEARDVYYAAQALFDGAKNGRGWPGLLTSDKKNKMIVAGHSQGGHAALWTGSSAGSDWAKATGMDLEGVVSVAPASDLNQLVETQWDTQANWILGPEVIQTYAAYLPRLALTNNVLGQAADPLGPNKDVLSRYESYCTTQAFAASYEYFPNGLQDPSGIPFMKNPDAAANLQAFYNWGQVFNAQTPVSDKSDNMNSKVSENVYPKDVPTQLISGTADQVVLSQVNAGLQQNFCAAGVNLGAYWTPVTTGVANPNPPQTDAYQAADHLNVMLFPFANNMGTADSPQYQLVGGNILQFAADRFAGNTFTKDCGDSNQPHSFTAPFFPPAGVTRTSWYVFPGITISGTKIVVDPNAEKFYLTNGDPALMLPSKPVTNTPNDGDTTLNPAPALGTVDTSTFAQEGCGLQWKNTGSGLKTRSIENPACYQWGLYPYNELIYKGASVADGQWAGKNGKSYPFHPPKP